MLEARRALRVRPLPPALVALVALAPALAGCLDPLPEHPEEGRHEVAPIEGVGRHSLRVNAFVVTWRAPGPGHEDHEMEWAVEGGVYDEGLFVLPAASAPGDEGSDFAFTLRYRLDGPHPVRLAHDATLARENTFNLTYRESVFWAGRQIDRVGNVSGESWLDVLTWERSNGDTAGRFHLEFEGWCAACEGERAGPHRVVLDGRYPKPRH